jgi:hypothetical protein
MTRETYMYHEGGVGNVDVHKDIAERLAVWTTNPLANVEATEAPSVKFPKEKWLKRVTRRADSAQSRRAFNLCIECIAYLRLPGLSACHYGA